MNGIWIEHLLLDLGRVVDLVDPDVAAGAVQLVAVRAGVAGHVVEDRGEDAAGAAVADALSQA